MKAAPNRKVKALPEGAAERAKLLRSAQARSTEGTDDALILAKEDALDLRRLYEEIYRTLRRSHGIVSACEFGHEDMQPNELSEVLETVYEMLGDAVEMMSDNARLFGFTPVYEPEAANG